MNFTQPQDFQYVQGANIDGAHPYGDLNRIEIDNDIMPVRNTEDKRKLRGIDIAFLMEAVEERARAIGLEDKSWTFSRNITLEQVNEIIARYNEIAEYDYRTEHYTKHIWIDENELPDTLTEYDKLSWDSFLPAIGLYEPEQIQEITDDTIVAETVESIYGKLEKLKNLAIPNCNPPYTPSLGNNGGYGQYAETYRESVCDPVSKGLTYRAYGRFDGYWWARANISFTGNGIELNEYEKGLLDRKFIGSGSIFYSSMYEGGQRTERHSALGIFQLNEDESLGSGYIENILSYLINKYGDLKLYGVYYASADSEEGSYNPLWIRPIAELRNRTRWDVEEDAE